jgi:hypothetical protein
MWVWFQKQVVLSPAEFLDPMSVTCSTHGARSAHTLIEKKP